MNVHPHSRRETRDLHDVAAVSQVPPARQATLWMTNRKSSSGSNSFTRPSPINLSLV